MHPIREDSETQRVLERLNSIPETESASRSEVLSELIAIAHPIISRFVSLYLRREPSVRHWANEEDVVQTAIMKIVSYLRKEKQEFSNANVFYSWCKTVAHRQVIDAIRSHRGRWSSRARFEPLPQGREVDESQEEPSELAVRSELAEEVSKALESLPDFDRSVISMRYFDGLSYREIAERLQVTDSSVRMRMFRAIQKIRNSIEGHRE